MVQRRLCVKDEAILGTIHARAIKEYQESVGQPPSGVLSAEQADKVLGLK